MNKHTFLSAILAGIVCLSASAQNYSKYKASGSIYHKGWIDLNKNGKKDIYEDPARTVDERIADLLSRMTLEEKTCQMVTLYGYGRILKDDLPSTSTASATGGFHLRTMSMFGLRPSTVGL